MARRVVQLIFTCLLSWAAAQADDEVRDLPGLTAPLCFRQFAGYAPVGKKQLFYWYTEAITFPEKAPLVLWLNGGPGCSSLGGMFTELGPFVVNKDQSVSLNPYAWNRVANVIYLDSPAGVGFSFPAAATNDSITAADAFQALLVFFNKHPDLQGRDFYLSGESYGGHYLPNLARYIQDQNARLNSTLINLKGFAVGNAYTDWRLDFGENVAYGRYHALTSPEDYETAVAACDGSTVACFWPRPGYPCSDACDAAVSKATENALDGSIDLYDIYSDVCLEGQQRHLTQQFVLERERRAQRHRMKAERDGNLHTTPISPIFPTCAENYAHTYLNNPAVQRAIHVNRTWEGCGLTGLYDFNFDSVVPDYARWAKDKSLNVMVYNGDADYILSFMGSEKWISTLNLDQLKPWQKWRGSDGQVAGYVVQYDGLTFATVKGAGHMVPKDRPQHALDMITAFLAGIPLENIKPQSYGPLCGAR